IRASARRADQGRRGWRSRLAQAWHAADPQLERPHDKRNRYRGWLSVRGPDLSFALGNRSRSDRCPLVGATLLRARRRWLGRAKRLALRASRAARSILANPPRRGSNRSSTAWMRSVRPAPPTSLASAMKVGP